MKWLWVAVILICLVASGAWCVELQLGRFYPRELAMGGTYVATTGGPASWLQNPGALGAGDGGRAQDDKEWEHQVQFSYADLGAGVDGFGLNWSGRQTGKPWGLGAGHLDLQNFGSVTGAGAGINKHNMPLGLGINVTHFDPDFGSGRTTFSFGMLYQFSTTRNGVNGLANGHAPVRVGLTINDLTSQIASPMWNAGVAWPVNGLLIAADVLDISSEIQTLFNVGAEYKLGAQDEFRVRAGLFDTGNAHKLSLGAAWAWRNWRFDGAWVDTNPGLWTAGARIGF